MGDGCGNFFLASTEASRPRVLRRDGVVFGI